MIITWLTGDIKFICFTHSSVSPNLIRRWDNLRLWKATLLLNPHNSPPHNLTNNLKIHNLLSVTCYLPRLTKMPDKPIYRGFGTIVKSYILSWFLLLLLQINMLVKWSCRNNVAVRSLAGDFYYLFLQWYFTPSNSIGV